METGQALDHEPGPAIRVKKKQRDRLIRLAGAHSEWVLGFADEVWWSRLVCLATSFARNSERLQ
jgi:hypothetical protein